MDPINPDKIIKADFTKNERQTRLIVILEEAFLETVQVKEKYQLLNSDDHHDILAKNKRKSDEARPDILHQTILSLVDSPLNKAGLLQIFIRTKLNQIIYINPAIKFPRTYKRFAGLMVQLLHKHIIRAADTGDVLLRLIKGPITRHIPLNIDTIMLSRDAEMVDFQDYVLENYSNDLNSNTPICFVIGAVAHGHLNPDYVSKKIAISQYPLSAASVAARVCLSFERLWAVK
ncbi:putative Ribosome biogenesis protein NEP1 [Spironucleus salmonicida]|uniref:Ribosome biogenesis protein NEP1 n=1 Tax=Spironucleus salmonicida TaxID=348837 RepID=V6LL03_9EUKA|nr:putative Ribosome biogenesis protein NEP1 [Spironucleus salmonicida]|eukprot:EST45310.1 Putative ribosome biogenesis protein NEP1 [Spironucleus salmonicida]